MNEKRIAKAKTTLPELTEAIIRNNEERVALARQFEIEKSVLLLAISPAHLYAQGVVDAALLRLREARPDMTPELQPNEVAAAELAAKE